jgi:hypothetical protein
VPGPDRHLRQMLQVFLGSLRLSVREAAKNRIRKDSGDSGSPKLTC